MLPEIYERWFVELCGRPSPVETRAQCDDCNMLRPEEPAPFNPATRCCTYHPHLPPHLVGALILDGNSLVAQKVAARDGATPLGLGPNSEYSARFARLGTRAEAFGHEAALLCPFHAETRCAIWAHRAIACAAFHCKFDRGPLGHGVWNLIVVAFHAVDHALLKGLLRHTGLDPAACDALLRAPTDGELEARAWGSWLGRERDYFIEASRLAAEARPSELPELARLGESLRGVVARLDARPAGLRRNPEVLYQLGRVHHPSVPFDHLDVDLERLDLEHLDEEMRRLLLDWQVLLPSEP